MTAGKHIDNGPSQAQQTQLGRKLAAGSIQYINIFIISTFFLSSKIRRNDSTALKKQPIA